MRTYFYLGLLGLLSSIAGWNREGALLFAGLMLMLWLCRKTLEMRF
jgi:hypothetical protein